MCVVCLAKKLNLTLRELWAARVLKGRVSHSDSNSREGRCSVPRLGLSVWTAGGVGVGLEICGEGLHVAQGPHMHALEGEGAPQPSPPHSGQFLAPQWWGGGQ